MYFLPLIEGQSFGLNESRDQRKIFDSMLGYLSADIICSSKLALFLEISSQKIVRLSVQIVSADKYPSIFAHQMEVIVYIYYKRAFYNYFIPYHKNTVTTTINQGHIRVAHDGKVG